MANDPYWSSTTLLLHGDTAGDPNFSSMVMAISGASTTAAEFGTLVPGNPTVATVDSRKCLAMAAADSGNYMGAYGAQTGVFDGDFTLEWWFYQTSDVSYNYYGGASVGATFTYSVCYLYFDSAGLHTISIKGAGLPGFTYKPPKNQWNHHALVVSGGVGSYYINGVRRTSGPVGATGAPTVNGFRFGYCPGLSNSGINGYLSGVRLYKGVARYSGASFTVPSWPDVPCSTVIDSSPASRGVSATGSALTPYVADYKYGGGCLRFDGSSYAETPASADFNFGTGDFTVEAWVYRQASGVGQALVSQWNNTTDLAWSMHIGPSNDLCFFTKSASFDYFLGSGGANALPLNQWVHCAISHKAGRRMLFLDGKLVGISGNMADIATGVSNTVLRLGRAVAVVDPFTGMLDDVRVTKGVARYSPSLAPVAVPDTPFQLDAGEPYWAAVILGMGMNNAGLTDAKGQSVSLSGVVMSTAQSKWGGASAYFNGASFLAVYGNPNMAIGTSDFTIEMWVYPTSLAYAVLFDLRPAGTDGVYPAIDIRGDGTIGFHMDTTTSTVSTEKVTLGAWSHIAVCRTAGVTCVFVNGVPGGYASDVRSYLAGSSRPVLGAVGYNTTAQRFTGYLDDVRVTKVCRYLSTFTPPAQAHPEGLTVVSGTVTDATGALCSRVVRAHSRATGRLLGTAVSDPVTGVYSIGAPEQCYVVVLDSTGDYDALILDRLDPVT